MPIIKISKDFSETPGGRYRNAGDFSAEEFRDGLLIDKYNEAEKEGTKLDIDFDGGYGYPVSFLEEVFGGLVRKYGKYGVINKLNIISKEDETIPDLIKKYVSDAEKARKAAESAKENLANLIMKQTVEF